MRRAWAWLKGKRFALAVTGAVLILLLAASAVQVSLDRSEDTHAAWDRTSPLETGRSVLDILGGVRQTLAAYMWTKTDDVHHHYYGGDISREQSLYPYYWLITRLDPNYSLAYYYASYMLCRMGKVDEGLRLAKEGVRNNPDSALLQENLASIYLFFKKDPAKALYHGRKAIDMAESEEDRFVYEQLQRVIERALAGEIRIPDPIPFQEALRLNSETHDHEHDHEHEHEGEEDHPQER